MYRRSRAHYTRPPCPSFKRAFSAPVPQVAFGTRRTALHNGAGNPLIYFTSLYPNPFLRSRPACARTARSARPDPRVTQFGLRVSPNFCCCPCSVRLCLSVAVRSAIGSHEARARSTPRATSGRSATWRSRGELESGLPPEAKCRSTPKRSKNIMAFCRFARVIYIKPRRSCVTVVISAGRVDGVHDH